MMVIIIAIFKIEIFLFHFAFHHYKGCIKNEMQKTNKHLQLNIEIFGSTAILFFFRKILSTKLFAMRWAYM